MCFYLRQSPKTSIIKRNVNYKAIFFVCICVLVIYQISFGTIIFYSRIINQLLYQSIIGTNNITTSNTNDIATFKPDNEIICSYKYEISNNEQQKPINVKNNSSLLFAENPFFLEEKMSKYFKDIKVTLSETKDRTKKILAWNKDFYGGLHPIGVPHGPDWFRDIGCPIWNCEITGRGPGRENNANLALPVEEYDAIYFFETTWFNQSLPAKRSPRQLYVWYSCEAPGFHSYLKKWNESANLFNITWSYRWDSDITDPYGSFRPITSGDIRNHRIIGEIKDNYAKGKKKMAVWIVSNCVAKNGRLEYVQQLQRHIPVDIYGECGNLTCTREEDHGCRTTMERDYKFVIAFENSMCLDYITEKYFTNIIFNTIPIVMDLHGNYAKMVPAKSYINAFDFPTVKGLADYLKVLDQNDTLYNEYFWWKRHYVFGEGSSAHNAACELCSRLHNPSQPVSVKKDLLQWWHHDASCKVIKFGQDNETWIAEDFNPPYDSAWPHGHEHWLRTVNL